MSLTTTQSANQPGKVCTGISGLDDILRGGFQRNRFFLLEGEPGTGKTTIALQFLLAGVARGESSLYITLSETQEELNEVASSHGWSLSGLEIFELSAIEQQLAIESQNTLFHPAEVELSQTTQILLGQIEKIAPRLLVLDSLSELRLLAQSSLRFRRQLLALKQFFAQRNCTVLFLDDLTSDATDLQVRSIAHGVISLEQLAPEYGAERRRLMVRKLRGVAFRGGFHDYTIVSGGARVFPRLVAAEHRERTPSGRVSSGLRSLDSLLGGGLDKGTSTLLMGPSGSGKSTVALQCAHAACAAGQRAVIFGFDETHANFLKRASSVGLPVETLTANESLRFIPIDPAELSPGEFVDRIRTEIQERGVEFVVIDSLNGYLQSMPAENYLVIQLHELLTYLNQLNIITVMVFTQHGLIYQNQSAVDLTYLSDTVLLLRYFEAQGEIRKAISVMKKRTGQHESTIREFYIDQGIHVGEPLSDFQGVFTGVPTYCGDLGAISHLRGPASESPDR